MDPTLALVLGVLTRFLHIASVVTLVGGIFYARVVLLPELPQSKALADRFRPWLVATSLTLLATGFYNFFMKASLVPRSYHMWFGIKFLFALHIIAVALLLTRPGMAEMKKANLMKGMVVSGLIVIWISAYLRWLARGV